jgi:hypothetical protein
MYEDSETRKGLATSKNDALAGVWHSEHRKQLKRERVHIVLGSS